MLSVRNHARAIVSLLIGAFLTMSYVTVLAAPAVEAATACTQGTCAEPTAQTVGSFVEVNLSSYFNEQAVEYPGTVGPSGQSLEQNGLVFNGQAFPATGSVTVNNALSVGGQGVSPTFLIPAYGFQASSSNSTLNAGPNSGLGLSNLRATGPLTIAVPPGKYTGVWLMYTSVGGFTAANGTSGTGVTLQYSDGTTQSGTLESIGMGNGTPTPPVFNVFNAPSMVVEGYNNCESNGQCSGSAWAGLHDGELAPQSVYPADSGFIHGEMLMADASKELTAITIDPAYNTFLNNPTIFAISLQLAASPPASETVSVSSSSVPANGTSAATVTAVVHNSSGGAVSGAVVDFSTNLGTLSAASATTNGSGVATVSLTSAQTGTATVTAAVAESTIKEQAPTVTFSAPPGSVTVSASPSSVMANGTSAATVTAVVHNSSGGAVSGAVVDFSTNLGTLSVASATANGSGVATVSLTSTQTGTATVKATQADTSATGQTQVNFTLSLGLTSAQEPTATTVNGFTEVDLSHYFNEQGMIFQGHTGPKGQSLGGGQGSVIEANTYPSTGNLTVTDNNVQPAVHPTFLIPSYAPGTNSALGFGPAITISVPTGRYTSIWLMYLSEGPANGSLNLYYSGGTSGADPFTFSGGFANPVSAPQFQVYNVPNELYEGYNFCVSSGQCEASSGVVDGAVDPGQSGGAVWIHGYELPVNPNLTLQAISFPSANANNTLYDATIFGISLQDAPGFVPGQSTGTSTTTTHQPTPQESAQALAQQIQQKRMAVLQDVKYMPLPAPQSLAMGAVELGALEQAQAFVSSKGLRWAALARQISAIEQSEPGIHPVQLQGVTVKAVSPLGLPIYLPQDGNGTMQSPYVVAALWSAANSGNAGAAIELLGLGLSMPQWVTEVSVGGS